ncbi:MAG: hypothetical protein LBQ70_04955 [Prevotellaceae bacterium]|nr:hypothetical protein [Prevotellaceae bacterium]
MQTLKISISDEEYRKFGISADRLAFPDLVNIVSRELTRRNLDKSIALAEKYGLSAMSTDEITEEVKAVRENAKN